MQKGVVQISQWELNLLISSLDNFNVHSKSKPYTHCKGILTNFDYTKWQHLLSAYYSTRLDSWYRSCTLLIAWSKTGITNCRSITKEQPMLHCFSYSLFQAPVLTACFKGSGKDPLPYLHASSPELAGPSYSGCSFCTCNCSWSQCYIDTSCWKSISVQCYQPWPLMK